MTVQQELRKCLLEYPGIFPNKWSVYHHWFCVNGNGYEWANGELTSGTTEELSLKEAVINQINEFTESIFGIEYLNFKIARLKQKISLLFKIEERIMDFTHTGIDEDYPIYPLCQYAQILNIPDDIKPDWKEAALEFAQWLLNSGIKIEKEHKEYLTKLIKK